MGQNGLEQMESWDGEPAPDFDEDLARGFIGKYLLVGITTVTHEGELLSQEQVHGVIVSATPVGIDVDLQGSQEGVRWRMPPFLEDLAPAGPGIYRLKASGESVENPDFLFTLTVRKPLKQ